LNWSDVMARHTSNTTRNAGFTLCSAMVAALLAGCAGQPTVASADSAQVADAQSVGQGEGISDAGLAKIEARVAQSPKNAALRAQLAQGYLAAGRFESAATTFEDALSLGDQTPRTGLSLALSYIGSGRNAEALGVLTHWRAQLPASDYGLGIALAGQPADAVTVLSEALRGGQNTPKMRQNLAYAYALDGRWAEARVIASQDVPADQLDARLGEWGSRARPEFGQARVAGLLGAPLRTDPGQPVALALADAQHAPRMAAAEPAPTTELPAVAPSEMAVAPEPAAPAFAAAPASASAPALAFAAAPTVQETPRSSIERAFDGSLARVQQPRAAPGQAASQGKHVVQLGSFSTMDGAKRAWAIYQRRDASLHGHSLRITEAEVRGRRYFRVAAVGFERGRAASLCSTVKQRGGECFAYESGRPLPGAIDTNKPARLARN
jgi:Flp pilus assembly protein TadD